MQIPYHRVVNSQMVLGTTDNSSEFALNMEVNCVILDHMRRINMPCCCFDVRHAAGGTGCGYRTAPCLADSTLKTS